MKNIFKISILIFFVFSFIGEASAASDSVYIRYWLICGPFKRASLNTPCIEDEPEISPIAGKVSSGKSWRKYLSCEDRLTFELDEVFGYCEDSIAYAYTEVYAPSSRKVKLYLGSDDGIKVWLNGKNIFTNDLERDFIYDEDKLDLSLNSGWNRLLIKVSNAKGYWGFSARLVKRGSVQVKDLTYRPQMLYQLPVRRVEVSSVQPTLPQDEGIFASTMAIDKCRYTRWTSEWTDPQWITLDLGSPKPIKKILLNWESCAKNYSIELSNDKVIWKSIYSTDIGDGGQDIINFKQPFRARYVRVKCLQRGTRFGYSLWELQVFRLKPEV